MTAKVRIGVLGAGNMGSFHANTVAHRTPETVLAALADLSERAVRSLAERTEPERCSTDPEEVIEDPSIQAVVIATPGHTHADLIERAAKAGKHIFCEKPIALELPAIDEALAAVRDAGVKLQVGLQRRFDPGFVRAKEMVERGEVGDLYIVHSRTRDPEAPPLEYLRGCGGLFRDTSVHDLDVVRWLSGCEAVEVYATGEVLTDPRIAEVGDVDTAAIVLRMENGAIATVDNSRRSVYGYDVRAEVFGSKGSVEVVADRSTFVTHRSKAGVCHDHPYWYLDRFAVAYEAEIRAFARCVLEDTRPQVTGEDGRAALVLGIAAQRSRAERRPVAVSEIE